MEKLINKKVAFVGLAIAGVVAIGTTVGFRYSEGVKIANSPLNQYTYYDSLESYPEIKKDMALRVEESMANGMSEEEACLEAIDWASDQIYTDAVDFYSQYNDDGWDADTDHQQDEYKQHIQKKFGHKIMEVTKDAE